jgi:hypothetical protein
LCIYTAFLLHDRDGGSIVWLCVQGLKGGLHHSTYKYLRIQLLLRMPGSVPRLGFQDDKNRFHRTAVAHVFAFVLRAFAAKPLGHEQWDHKTAELEAWGRVDRGVNTWIFEEGL